MPREFYGVSLTPLKTLTAIVGLLLLAYLFVVSNDLGKTVVGKAKQPQAGLFPHLLTSNEGIHRISLTQASEQIRLELRDRVWRIGAGTGLEGHIVNNVLVTKLIKFVGTAKYIEKKTDKRTKLYKLGLGSSDSDSVLLSVHSIGGNESMLIGNRAQSGMGTFVRLPDSTQSWLVSGEVELPKREMGWLPEVILDVSRSEISKATFTASTGATVIVSGALETESAVIENMPLTGALAYPSAADPALTSLVNLRLKNVSKADRISWDDAAIAEFELVTGDSISLRCVEQKGEYWIWITHNKKSENWSYSIDEYRFTQLTKTMSDYLAPVSSNQ